MLHRFTVVVTYLFIFFFSSEVYAQAGGGGTDDVAIVQIDQLLRQGVDQSLASDGADLLGDKIDTNTGSLVFEHVDVSLPGNSGLEVAVRRRREQGRKYTYKFQGDFGDWQIDIPQIWTKTAQGKPPTPTDASNGGVFASNRTTPAWPGYRCTSPTPGPIFWGDTVSQSNAVEADGYSDGLFLQIPGAGSKHLLHVHGRASWPSDVYKGTTDGWAVRCISSIPTGLGAGNDYSGRGGAAHDGEGFIAIAPNGDQYRFDRLIYRDAPAVANSKIDRYYAFMLATEVSDVHGNWVRYTYDDGGYLTRIHSNDGRQIELYYEGEPVSTGPYSANSKRINRVVANGRTWRYSYYQSSLFFYLTSVTLPDDRHWTMNLLAMDYDAATGGSGTGDDCKSPTVDAIVTHPNGITGRFTLSEVRHGRTYVPSITAATQWNCFGHPEPGRPYFDVHAIARKELSGPAFPSAEWNYTYFGDNGAFNNSGGLPDTRRTQLVDPTGTKTIYSYSRRWGALDGKLVKQETFASSSSTSPLETIVFTYLEEAPIGETYLYTENVEQLSRPLRMERTNTKRGSDEFFTRYTYNSTQSSPSYSFGNPIKVERWNNLSPAIRTTNTVYTHKTNIWRLGLPVSNTRNGKLFDTYTYDSLGRVTQQNLFGALRMKVGYHSAGDQKGAVAWVEDALTRRTSFNSYKRGRPQSITRPDSATLTRVVDDNGWVTSETNARGHTTGYEYNNAGWLTRIDRPSPYNDTTLSYSLSNGVTLQTATRGPARTTTYYDGMLRPYRVKTQPLSGGGQTTYVRTEYDALGRVTFTSLPSTAFTPTEGATTTYDALGRVTSVAENIFPYATTTTRYLSGNRIEVTDPAGHRTTTTYQAFGDPDNRDEPTRIAQPEGVITDMTYDNYGNLLTARQHGNSGGYSGDQIQKWFYDSRLRVCSHVVAETGRTLYQYDAADQMTGLARGQGIADGCASLPSNVKVAHSYDTLGRLTAVNFPSTTPDIAITYDANGNVTRNQRGVTDWRYIYDSADQLTEEKLLIDGRTYTAQYEYNASGHLNVYRSPSSRRFAFSPNGLGQPKQMHYIGTSAYYANNMAYHVNGQPKSFHYRNGHIYSMHLDARQLPQRIRSRKDGVAEAANFTYAYDANGRITIQRDWAVSGEDRNYTYDGLGRLKTASGPWGSGTYAYDPLNNIRRKTLGSRTVDLTYTSRNRLATVRDTGGAGQTLSYVHDSRGNVVWDARGQGAYSYDWSEQPVTVSGAGASGNFVYDGNFKRVKQTINGKTIYSVYGQSGALLYRDNPHNSADRADYLRVAGMTIGRIEGSGASYREVFLHNDHLGSPVAATDGGGAVLWRESRTPFGEKLNDPADNRDDIGFTGHIEDADTGLTYMQARYYDPVVGRFHSNDPVGFAEGGVGYFNRYAYTFNDPVNLIDPDGLAPGDRFNTPEEAAIDAVEYINPQSIEENVEYGGTIQREVTIVGSNPDGSPKVETQYYATEPEAGDFEASSPAGYDPDTTVGEYHTHGDYAKYGADGSIERATQDENRSADRASIDDRQGAYARRAETREARSVYNERYVAKLGTPSGEIKDY